MPNALYPKWKQELMASGPTGSPGGLNWTVRAVLVDTSVYTYNPAHSRRSDLTGVVGNPSGVFTNKTVSDDGVFDADNISFIGVTGPSAGAIVIFVDQGAPSLDRLVTYLDSGFSGLPATPDGSDIPVTWSPNGIFRL